VFFGANRSDRLTEFAATVRPMPTSGAELADLIERQVVLPGHPGYGDVIHLNQSIAPG